MGLTYTGMSPRFAPWAELPSVRFAQLLIRLAMASRAVAENDAKLGRMDEWLVKHEWESHPLFDERFARRETLRSEATQLRNAEHRLMEEALAFFIEHAPKLDGQHAKAAGLLSQFGGQWPADPEHKGIPERRIPWDQLGGTEDALAPF